MAGDLPETYLLWLIEAHTLASEAGHVRIRPGPRSNCRGDVRPVRLAWPHVCGAWLVPCVRVAGACRGEVLPLAVWRPGR